MAHFVKEARVQQLQSFRNCFSEELRERLERELGLEDCLRQLWHGLVGPSLTANTQFHGLRGDRLIVDMATAVSHLESKRGRVQGLFQPSEREGAGGSGSVMPKLR